MDKIIDHEYFDKLRRQAQEIDRPDSLVEVFSLTKALFVNVIDSMERIHNLIVETKVDLKRHDEHGRVTMAKGIYMPDKGC